MRPSVRQAVGALGIAAGITMVPLTAIALTSAAGASRPSLVSAAQSGESTTTTAPVADGGQDQTQDRRPGDGDRPDPAVMQAFDQCLADQGLPAPPKGRGHGRGPRDGQQGTDEGSTGDSGTSGTDQEATPPARPTPEQFQAAFDACKDKLPEDVRTKMEQEQQQRQAFEQCLADNGLPKPDPNADPSTTTRPDKATVQKAMEACKDLRPEGRGFGPGGPGGPGRHGRGGPGCDHDGMMPPSDGTQPPAGDQAPAPANPDDTTPSTSEAPSTTTPETTPGTDAPADTAPSGTGARYTF